MYGQIIHHEGTDPDGLAGVYLAANDLNAAAAMLGEVLKKEPRDSDALLLRTDLSLHGGAQGLLGQSSR